MIPFQQLILWICAGVSMYFAIFWFLVLIDTPPVLQRRHWQHWPSLTVAIPAWNEEDCIRETMESVLAADYPADKLQLLIINDGSKDKTEEIAKQVAAEHPHRNIEVVTQKNAGKGAGMNRALGLASGEFFATMDSDSRVFPDAPKKLLAYFVSDDIAAVVPSMKSRNPKTFLQKLQWYEYNVNMFYKDLMGRVNALHVIPGPFPIYRAEILRKVGGFVEKGNLTEDLEITLRLQREQYRIVQAMDAVVDTITPSTWKAFYAQRNRWFKGAFLNAMAYRKLAFKREYGDFGMIQMPTLIISGILALVLLGTGLYGMVRPIITLFQNLQSVHFDVVTLLLHLRLNFSLFDLDSLALGLACTMLLLSIYIFIEAHRAVQEPILKHGWFAVGMFLLVYYAVLGIVWTGVALDLMRGKHQRW